MFSPFIRLLLKQTFIFLYYAKTFIFKTFTNYYQAMSILAVQIKLHIVKVL